MKTYKVEFTTYSNFIEKELQFPDDAKFVETPCTGIHRETDTDFVTFMDNTEENYKLLRSQEHMIFFRVYNFGPYLMVTLNSVNKDCDIPRISREELLSTLDFSDLFFMSYIKDKLTAIFKFKSFLDAERVIVDEVYRGELYDGTETIEIKSSTTANIDFLMNKLPGNVYENMSEIFIICGEEGEILYNSLIARGLKHMGIAFKNEFVKETDDFLDLKFLEH